MTQRYNKNFRANELKLICDCARKGQSVCMVGVAGSGKSNIVNVLHSDPYHYRSQYLGEWNETTFFPVSAGNTWDGTPISFWRSLASALRELESERLTLHIAQDDAQSEQQAMATVKTAIREICRREENRLMVILDDIDDVVRSAPGSMWENLLAMRNDGNRDRLSFLLLTKLPPNILGKSNNFDKLNFYKLLMGHIFALGLYDRNEIHQMLHYMNSRETTPLNEPDLEQIAIYSGGHAHLAKMLFNHWLLERPAGDVSMAYLASRVEIANECRRILQHLHPEEQSVALRFARNQQTSYDSRVIDHLVKRGLITDAAKGFWFSPLMGEFLRTYAKQHTA